MSRVTRRDFLKRTAAGAAGAGIALPGMSALSASNVVGANERFRIAVCGLNGRGNSHMKGYMVIPGVEIAYVVDPDKNVAGRAARGYSKRAKTYKIEPLADVRKALDDKNVDAISVATPNHWHSLMAIWAAQAGKHCYVEKPASHDIYEGRVAAEAYKKYKVIIQHGTQQRSSQGRANLMKAIHDGKFGKLKIAYGYACKRRKGIGFQKPSAPPDWLDWNLWRGPAVIDKYHANYVHYDWHWFWETGNGDLNNQGTHQLDVARWAIDPDQTHPVRAMALGGRFKWDDQGETPNTMFAIAEYPNGQSVFFNVRNVDYPGYKHQVMNEFYFEDGGWIDKDQKYYPPGSKTGERIELPHAKITPGGTFGSFVTACRANDQSMINGNMVEAHYSSVTGHVMNNSYRIGKKAPFDSIAGKLGDRPEAHKAFMKLHKMMVAAELPADNLKYTVGPWLTFDPKTERFTGEHADEANKLVRDPQRNGFEIPDVDNV